MAHTNVFFQKGTLPALLYFFSLISFILSDKNVFVPTLIQVVIRNNVINFFFSVCYQLNFILTVIVALTYSQNTLQLPTQKRWFIKVSCTMES